MIDFGLIETIKVVNGRFLFKELHLQRLAHSFQLLGYTIALDVLEQQLYTLYQSVAEENAKFRVEIHLPEHASFENIKWQVSTEPLTTIDYQLESPSKIITVSSAGLKPINAYSNLKTTQRNIYTHALEQAQQRRFDDALILNDQHVLAEASIYNVFIVKDKKIYTPSLENGPVAGVFRRYLIENLKEFPIIETTLTIGQIYLSDEIFFTNVIRGIVPINRLDNRYLSSKITKSVFEAFKATL